MAIAHLQVKIYVCPYEAEEEQCSDISLCLEEIKFTPMYDSQAPYGGGHGCKEEGDANSGIYCILCASIFHGYSGSAIGMKCVGEKNLYSIQETYEVTPLYSNTNVVNKLMY